VSIAVRVVALIIGAVIYSVKPSIDRGLMGPTGRVAVTLFGVLPAVSGDHGL